VLAAILAGLMCLAACTSGSPRSSDSSAHPTRQPVPTDGRPNIVFILTDDLSTNLVPYMPHVRALEASGASFQHYFVVDSLCCPSRSAIFTGLYPHDDGVFTNTGSDGGYSAYNHYRNPARSFAVALSAAGYQTGFMGKYLNGYLPKDPQAPGWDVWDVAGNGYPEFNYNLNENGVVHSYGDNPSDYLTNVLGQKATEFIDGAQYTGKPFALEVATFAPHSPYTPAPLDDGTFPTLSTPRSPSFGVKPTDPPRWLAAVPPLPSEAVQRMTRHFRLRVEASQAVDRMIGQIEKALAATNQLANTYIVFSSDNGFHMGEHGLWSGKQTAFDTDIRVPLVVAGPGVPPGTTINAMASSIDLAPTFQNIAHARPAFEPDGVSLLDRLHGKPAPVNWQRAILVEHHGPVVDPNDPDRQPVSSGNPPSYEAMRTATALYVEYATGEREYYDLARDPFELHNVAGRLSPQRLAELHATLQGLATCHGATQCQRVASQSGV
jgi:arylsulfatase A-like enzyme